MTKVNRSTQPPPMFREQLETSTAKKVAYAFAALFLLGGAATMAIHYVPYLVHHLGTLGFEIAAGGSSLSAIGGLIALIIDGRAVITAKPYRYKFRIEAGVNSYNPKTPKKGYKYLVDGKECSGPRFEEVLKLQDNEPSQRRAHRLLCEDAATAAMDAFVKRAYGKCKPYGKTLFNLCRGYNKHLFVEVFRIYKVGDRYLHMVTAINLAHGESSMKWNSQLREDPTLPEEVFFPGVKPQDDYQAFLHVDEGLKHTGFHPFKRKAVGLQSAKEESQVDLEGSTVLYEGTRAPYIDLTLNVDCPDLKESFYYFANQRTLVPLLAELKQHYDFGPYHVVSGANGTPVSFNLVHRIESGVAKWLLEIEKRFKIAKIEDGEREDLPVEILTKTTVNILTGSTTFEWTDPRSTSSGSSRPSRG